MSSTKKTPPAREGVQKESLMSSPQQQDGKLRFYARRDLLVTVPHIKTGVRYVGRQWSKELNGWPATSEPYAVKPDSESAARLKLLIRRDKSLWAADEFTARECGVKFVKTNFVGGEHVPAQESVSNG